MKTYPKKSIVIVLFILLATVALATTAVANEVVGEATIFNQEALQDEQYVLATVPIVEFDAETLVLSMASLWAASDSLQYHLDQAAAGDKDACEVVVALHIFVWQASAVHTNVPAQFARAHNDYIDALVTYFDSVNPAMESCFATDMISGHEYGAARLGIDKSRTILEPYFN